LLVFKTSAFNRSATSPSLILAARSEAQQASNARSRGALPRVIVEFPYGFGKISKSLT
jgi:hypothetical protein